MKEENNKKRVHIIGITCSIVALMIIFIGIPHSVSQASTYYSQGYH